MNLVTKNKLLPRVMGGLFAVIAATTVYHEGTGISADGNARAYLDGAARWTICSGDTKNVVKGQVESAAECKTRLRYAIQEHAQALAGLPESTPDYAVLAMMDFAYHVGVSGAQNSTTYKHLMLGNEEDAAKAIGDWRYISNNSMKGEAGWRYVNGKYRYDCSTVGNKVCAGIWKRRMWQMDTMQGKLGTAKEAEAALPRYTRIYAENGKWVIPAK